MRCEETDLGAAGGALRAIASGVEAVLGHRLLRPLVSAAALYNFYYSALLTVFLTHAVARLGLPTAAVGGVLASASIGAITGSASSEKLARGLGLGRMIVTCAGGVVAPLMLIPLARSGAWPSITLLASAFTISTFFTSAKNVQTVSLRQLVTPTWALGRVSATAWFLVLGALPLGAYAGGLVGELWGTTTAQIAESWSRCRAVGSCSSRRGSASFAPPSRSTTSTGVRSRAVRPACEDCACNAVPPGVAGRTPSVACLRQPPASFMVSSSPARRRVGPAERVHLLVGPVVRAGVEQRSGVFVAGATACRRTGSFEPPSL
jgi:hypothetical protein